MTSVCILTIMIFILIQFVWVTEEYSHFDPHRRPKLMGEILPFKSITPERQRVRNKIVMYHNYFRSKVEPKASNMLKMKWHKGAARAAQKWADKCQFLVHDGVVGRRIDGYGSCGQNIFIATTRVPWLFAIETWWLEKNNFKYGGKNNMTLTGHYTQLVWAATHEVGCGLAKCYFRHPEAKETEAKARVFYNYVCNYCPIGNRPGKMSHPYKLGNPCSACKKNCSKKLCSNACDVADVWANCKELYKIHPMWLCRTHTPKGRQRAQHCKATCTCRNKIFD
ncbi:cysteine-rich secretory protein 3-like [Anthonomus grandis grandis]|uniref:cysteine-rich secretory protein 3-like n=1 Tax=Anthonomus grandis grandis TaxID=2921223 RepID=UPI0021663922|nr:cysteine-rich secretory protein 3-like [Anthonomus grandis grandis]